MSSLLGMTYGVPVVTFETPGDALPIKRLGLPSPPSFPSRDPQEWNNTGTFHFGITSDPIFMGTCRGLLASCTFAGYSFESLCHTGKKCVYDVVKDLGWHSSILSHGITSVISDVLERYEDVPECVDVGECMDCEGWKEVGGGSETKTETGTMTSTGTRSCATPGWFGCKDRTSFVTATPKF